MKIIVSVGCVIRLLTFERVIADSGCFFFGAAFIYCQYLPTVNFYFYPGHDKYFALVKLVAVVWIDPKPSSPAVWSPILRRRRREPPCCRPWAISLSLGSLPVSLRFSPLLARLFLQSYDSVQIISTRTNRNIVEKLPVSSLPKNNWLQIFVRRSCPPTAGRHDPVGLLFDCRRIISIDFSTKGRHLHLSNLRFLRKKENRKEMHFLFRPVLLDFSRVVTNGRRQSVVVTLLSWRRVFLSLFTLSRFCPSGRGNGKDKKRGKKLMYRLIQLVYLVTSADGCAL